ncbi:outer membrane protein [Chthonobacter rhizosphaerae]|uniref:outer membrane protein n=1 Tax=Chthonobacter rhizosphaerae TaxID=2735553 RepID=UPI0015EF2B28|nr:outer membrane protein [Chthonobacter rhizosphaerae]
MKYHVLAAVAAAAVAGLLGPATAADMPEYPIIETPEPMPLPAVGGWYLRGDIGYKVYETPDAVFDAPGYGRLFDESMDDTAVIGFGVGYQVNEYLRLDTTLDYEFKAGYAGRLACLGPCGGGTSLEEADIDAWTGLVNAYVDVATWGSLTPYVGAGIGASYVSTSNVRADAPPGSRYDGDSTWNLSWALMAGTAVRVSENMLIDFNYRYLHLGDAKSDTIPTFTQSIEYEDIAAHEFRVGLRYNLF